MNIFYSTARQQDHVLLDENESGHAVRVLRMPVGEKAILFDGKGNIHTAVIEDNHPKRCLLRITGTEFHPAKAIQLHIGIAPTKMNERMEWFLEKATELGISRITPLLCSRSERKVINEDRFSKVVVAAMKQSMNPWLPVLDPMTSFSEFISQHQSGYIAHCISGLERNGISSIRPDHNIIRVLIGPEGDFTPEEVDLALKTGYLGLSLGESRLRTETAGLMICAAVRLTQDSKS
jgi:16S rRNA (uracil1498-N3)-methyltransferase